MKFVCAFYHKSTTNTRWKCFPLKSYLPIWTGKCFKIFPWKSHCTRDRSVPVPGLMPVTGLYPWKSHPLIWTVIWKVISLFGLENVLKIYPWKSFANIWPSLTFEEFLYLYNVSISRPKYVKHFTLVVSSWKAIWPEFKHSQCCKLFPGLHWLTKWKKSAGAWDISTDSSSLRVTYT